MTGVDIYPTTNRSGDGPVNVTASADPEQVAIVTSSRACARGDCRALFTPGVRQPYQRFCSERCARRAYRGVRVAPLRRVCRTCHEPFGNSLYATGPRYRYCSTTCYRRRDWRARRDANLAAFRRRYHVAPTDYTAFPITRTRVGHGGRNLRTRPAEVHSCPLCHSTNVEADERREWTCWSCPWWWEGWRTDRKEAAA